MADILSSFMCFLSALKAGHKSLHEKSNWRVFLLKILGFPPPGERASRVVSPKRKELISQLEGGKSCGLKQNLTLPPEKTLIVKCRTNLLVLL